MNRSIGWKRFLAGLYIVLLVCANAGAQQKTQSAPQQRSAYEVGREVLVQGTVVSFTENSGTPPLGPHVVVQTASGQVDIHLGDARLLKANRFALATGDSVRIVGENISYGTGNQFFARVIQKGSQTLALRSTRGFPLRPATKAGKSEAGVL